MDIREKIANYQPFNEQEIKDKEYFLKWLDTFNDCLTRQNEFGHFTASAFVINEARNKMLVVYHSLYGDYIYPGGHADGESDLLSVAIREVEEETGLKTKPINTNIFGIGALTVDGHIKKGKYVSAHTHLDVVYLLEGNEKDDLCIKEDENKDVKWVDFETAISDEMCDFIRPIHHKLIRKLEKKIINKH